MIFAPRTMNVRLFPKVIVLLALLLGGALCIHLLTFSMAGTDTDLDYQRQFNERYRIFSLTLPERIVFCEEAMPLDKIDVRERMDRELLVNTYWQSNSILAHKRAHRWFPVIEPILAEEGVPDDLKYVALSESGLTNITSPVGAVGFWQFMKETATAHGLEVNDEVDERYNVVRATRAACKYLREAKEKYGTWSMAAASYDLGPAGLDRQIGRQKVSDYYSMLLPEETSRYMFRVLALKTILSDPERFGFHLREKDLYQPYRTRSITITGPVPDWADFATQNGTDYKTLKLLNPWLRDTKLTNAQGKTYEILLPGEGFDKGADE